MTKPIPSIQKYMSTSPLTIGQEQSIVKAKEIMGQNSIRHLPVLEDGKIIGILSDRDVHLISYISGLEPSQLKVKDAMSLDPYTVSPDASLDEVAQEMFHNKYGSAVVMQNEKVVGIFTAIDGLSALAELLHTRLAK